MNLVLEFNRENLANLQLPVMVESYDKIRERGSKQRAYHKEFTEKERKVISWYYHKAYGWYLRTGYPERFIFRKIETVELVKRAVNFFASI